MLRALNIQIQPDRAPGLKIEEVQTAFEGIARVSSLVQRHQFDEGYDEGRHLNFTFGTENLAGLWSMIQSAVYHNPSFVGPMAKASIAVCEGEDGWNDYLQLFHFDPTEPRDELGAI